MLLLVTGLIKILVAENFMIIGLKIQKDVMVKQLIQFPDLYDTKSNLPLEISQRAFDHIWRMCESYELWCKETKQNEFIQLNITD